MPAFEVICELLHRRDIEGATALLGLDGTARGHRQPSHFFSRDGGIPMAVVAVGPVGLLGPVLPEPGGLLRHPLITLSWVRVCNRDSRLISRPIQHRRKTTARRPSGRSSPSNTSEEGQHGQPVHRAIVHRLRSAGTSGATVHRGIWGFHGDQ
jgi:PII-like signaling protein